MNRQGLGRSFGLLGFAKGTSSPASQQPFPPDSWMFFFGVVLKVKLDVFEIDFPCSQLT